MQGEPAAQQRLARMETVLFQESHVRKDVAPFTSQTGSEGIFVDVGVRGRAGGGSFASREMSS